MAACDRVMTGMSADFAHHRAIIASKNDRRWHRIKAAGGTAHVLTEITSLPLPHIERNVCFCTCGAFIMTSLFYFRWTNRGFHLAAAVFPSAGKQQRQP